MVYIIVLLSNPFLQCLTSFDCTTNCVNDYSPTQVKSEIRRLSFWSPTQYHQCGESCRRFQLQF